MVERALSEQIAEKQKKERKTGFNAESAAESGLFSYATVSCCLSIRQKLTQVRTKLP